MLAVSMPPSFNERVNCVQPYFWFWPTDLAKAPHIFEWIAIRIVWVAVLLRTVAQVRLLSHPSARPQSMHSQCPSTAGGESCSRNIATILLH